MKKRDKEVVGMIVLMVKDIIVIIVFMVIALIFLFCGSLAWDSGEEGKAIVLIMCSLYVAMYIHAGMIASLINSKLRDVKKELSNSGIAGKVP